MGVLSQDLGIAKLSALREKLDEQQEKRKRLQQNDALELQVQEIQDTIRKISDQKRCRELYPAENRRILVFYSENCGFCCKKVRTFQIAFLPKIRP